MSLEAKQMAVQLIDEAVTNGARQALACGILGISDKTYRRWKSRDDLSDGRAAANATKVCNHALTQEEKQSIVELSLTDEFKSLPPSQIVPRLADRGIYMASESTFYRVLKEHKLVNRRGKANPPNPRPKPTPLTATGPNQVWSWDITYLPSAVRGEFFKLYLIMDVFSRMVVGWDIFNDENALHASEVISKACLRHGVQPEQLVLHSDNGGPMKGATMLSTLQDLGVVPSFSRPSVSDDNPFSEALFKTLKYTPSYPANGRFSDKQNAQVWVHQFVNWYNHEHRHSGIRYVTPAERHAGLDKSILAKRMDTYEAAKQAYPARWGSRNTRNWTPIRTVRLNPLKEAVETTNQQLRAA